MSDTISFGMFFSGLYMETENSEGFYRGEIFTIELRLVHYSAFWAHFIVYRTRASINRSQLVTAPLNFHWKKIIFMRFLCYNFKAQKIFFGY